MQRWRQGLSSIAHPFHSLLLVVNVRIGLMAPIVDQHGLAAHKAIELLQCHTNQVDLSQYCLSPG